METTTGRVTAHTASVYNEKIARQTERNIQYYAAHPEEIDARLEELDREWDVERTLEMQASSLTLASVVLGTFVSRKWLYLPAVVGGFLLQHALQGWCPPVPVFRRFGIRTQTEIKRERYALKALRGDFDNVNAAEGGGNVISISARVLEAIK